MSAQATARKSRGKEKETEVEKPPVLIAQNSNAVCDDDEDDDGPLLVQKLEVGSKKI